MLINDTVGAWLSNSDLSQTQSQTDTGNLLTYIQSEDAISALTNIDSPKDDYSGTNLSKVQVATDSWLAAYYKLILIPETEGYQWLLSRLKREFLMAPAKPSFMATINNLITQKLTTRPPQSTFLTDDDTPIKTYNAEFEVDWAIQDFLKQQQNSNAYPELMERIITVTGSYQDSYVTTCGQYVDQIWPSSGRIIMQLVEGAVDNKNRHDASSKSTSQRTYVNKWYHLDDPSTETTLKAMIDGSKIIVTAYGPMTSVVELGEQLAWLGAALRTPPQGHGLACCCPFISFPADDRDLSLYMKGWRPVVKFKIGFRDEIQQDPGRLNGICWHNLFKNPMVVKGYPIPAKVETGTGAEIPFNIMAGMARAQRVECFKGMTFVKGFSTLLVPTKRTGDMIFWHLFYNKDGQRISYLDSTITSLGYAKSLDLEQCRHVLGWCEDAAFYAGRILHKIVSKNVANACSPQVQQKQTTLFSILRSLRLMKVVVLLELTYLLDGP